MIRLEIVQKKIENLETQLEHFKEELEFLKRIDKPHIKSRYFLANIAIYHLRGLLI